MTVTTDSLEREPFTVRQSTLRAFETCPRRTRFEVGREGDRASGFVGWTDRLGTAAHDVVEEATRTLLEQDEQNIPVPEMLEIMYEVIARKGHALPSDEREELRWLCARFAAYPWYPRRLLAMEERLAVDLPCPDGVVRRLTGTPDMIFADPGGHDRPSGVIIPDFKSTRAQPRRPRAVPAGQDDEVEGKQYLSERGHFQLDCYGVLALERYPAAEYALLREMHLRSGKVRAAKLWRSEVPDVKRELAVQVELFERAVSEGEGSPLWQPRPGRHCYRACPVNLSCPVPLEERGDGFIADEEDADRWARSFVVGDAQRERLRRALKAFHEETGHAPRLPDGRVMRWKGEVGNRSFGLHWPDDEVVGDA